MWTLAIASLAADAPYSRKFTAKDTFTNAKDDKPSAQEALDQAKWKPVEFEVVSSLPAEGKESEKAAAAGYDAVDDIGAVFDEIARGHMDLGLVPIENSSMGGIGETLRCLEFAFRRNYFRAAFPFSFGLFGHSSLHFLWQVDLFNFYIGHLYTPGFCIGINDLLELVIYFFPLGKQVIQLGLSQHTSKRSL